MFVRHLHIHQLPVPVPPQASLRSHSTVAQSTIRSPFLDNVSDELHLLSEIVGLGNTLDHRVDFGPFPGRGFDRARWLRHEVEEGL